MYKLILYISNIRIVELNRLEEHFSRIAGMFSHSGFPPVLKLSKRRTILDKKKEVTGLFC